MIREEDEMPIEEGFRGLPNIIYIPFVMPKGEDQVFLPKRSDLTSENINKLTRPRFGKRALADLENYNQMFVSKRLSGLTSESVNKLTRPRFGKRSSEGIDEANYNEKDILNILKRSTELMGMLRPRFG